MDISPVTLAAHLRPHRVARLQPLRGGAKKAVSRVHCEDGFTCILYVWDPAAAYAEADASDGARALAHNHAHLKHLGVRTPEILHAAGSFAIVEDVGDLSLVECRDAGVLARLGDMVARMHHDRADGWGPLAEPDRRSDSPCEQAVMERTLADLAYLERRLPGFAPNRQRLTEVAQRLFAAVRPRRRYGLIHGELGPEHVRVGRDGRPCLIDIEGASFFDVEYEHSFLAFRFGDRYQALRAESLDRPRLLFYRLHLHLRCTAGPLAIIDRGYPDAAGMMAIVEANLAAAMRFPQPADGPDGP